MAIGDRPPLEDVGHWLFYSHVATDALDQSIAHCDAATTSALASGMHEWTRYLTLARANLATLATACASRRMRCTAVASQAASGPEAVDTALCSLGDAMGRAQMNGFAEARHRMSFPRAQGFSGDDDFHTTDVFQRALIGWLYERLLSSGRHLSWDRVEDNLRALAAARLPGQRGGWS